MFKIEDLVTNLEERLSHANTFLKAVTDFRMAANEDNDKECLRERFTDFYEF